MSNENRDRLWNFLFGRPIPLHEAQMMIEQLQQQALVQEAEQAAHGARHLTVAHGDLETDEDTARARQLWQWAWDNGARGRIVTRTTNDTTSWVISGPEAEQLLAEIEALAQRLNPGWWRIQRAAR